MKLLSTFILMLLSIASYAATKTVSYTEIDLQCPNYSQALLASQTAGSNAFDIEGNSWRLVDIKYPLPTGNSGWSKIGVLYTAQHGIQMACHTSNTSAPSLWDSPTIVAHPGGKIPQFCLVNGQPIVKYFEKVYGYTDKGQPIWDGGDSTIKTSYYSPDATLSCFVPNN